MLLRVGVDLVKGVLGQIHSKVSVNNLLQNSFRLTHFQQKHLCFLIYSLVDINRQRSCN